MNWIEMNFNDVMQRLELLGTEQTKKIYKNHGAKDPIFGVKVADLKKLKKETGIDLELSKQLFDSNNVDAQYFAGLITEPKKLTKAEIQGWAVLANWYMISEYTVAWVAAESPFGLELAMDWIDSDLENLASSAWATLSALLAIKDAKKPDKAKILSLLSRIEENILQSKNRVKYTMNGFIISVGTFYPDLILEAQSTAKNIGKVEVYLGRTNCKVPFAPEYLTKIIHTGRWGKQRKTFRS